MVVSKNKVKQMFKRNAVQSKAHRYHRAELSLTAIAGISYQIHTKVQDCYLQQLFQQVRANLYMIESTSINVTISVQK